MAYNDDNPAFDEYNWLNDRVYSDRYRRMLAKRQRLPVWQYREDFLAKLRVNNVVLVEAETGSGKTTQIPQWCLEYLKMEVKHTK